MAKGFFAATAKPKSAETGRAAEQTVAKAQEGQGPRPLLDKEQAMLEACQRMYAMSLLGGEPGRGADQLEKDSNLESVFGNTARLPANR
jgi:hypothetical protein